MALEPRDEPVIALVAGWALGTAQGVRHAFEPDHLAAVSTVVAEQRSSRASFRYAAAWGAGHALMLTCVGGTLFALRTAMPERLAALFEIVVGVMLVGLGARALVFAVKMKRDPRAHRTRGHLHTPPPAMRVSGRSAALRPLLIGIVHGLAGSGALTALVMAKLPSMVDGIVFMALYGAGAMLGMALLAGVAGGPLARLARTRNGMPLVLALTGLLSLGLGAAWTAVAASHVMPASVRAR
jgi:hypothetical protein